MNEILKHFSPIVFPTATSEVLQKMISDMEQSFKQPIKQVFPYPIDIIKYYSNENKKIVRLTFKVALAGTPKEAIKVQLKKNRVLVISVNHPDNETDISDDIEEIYVNKSISYRDGEISFKLFSDVDLENFKPEYKDGLLTINVYFKDICKEDDIIDFEIQ